MVARSISEIRAVGGSMSPFILSGSRLFVKRMEPGRIRVGDVVCYIGGVGLGIAHRVVQVTNSPNGKLLHLRGDTQKELEIVPETAVLYVVNRVAHRRLSYKVDGPVGRFLTRVALAENAKYSMMKAVFSRSWNIVRSMSMIRRDPIRQR